MKRGQVRRQIPWSIHIISITRQRLFLMDTRASDSSGTWPLFPQKHVIPASSQVAQRVDRSDYSKYIR